MREKNIDPDTIQAQGSSPIRGVIFDLDGTLLDTVHGIAAAANEALQAHGLPMHEVAAFHGFVGHGSFELMRRAAKIELKRPDESLVQELEEGFQAAYERHWRSSKLYPGVDSLLDAVSERGWPMAVLSNKPHVFTVKCVQSLLSPWRFFPLFGRRQQVPRKPAPQVALGIASQWQIPPSEIAFVGDTDVDMQTAQRAGMPAFGVLWGFQAKDRLDAFSAPLSENPRELRRHLGL